MSFVNTVDLIGDETLTNSIIDRSITEIADNNVTSIGNYAFYECQKLTTANFPVVTDIGNYAFSDCTSLTMANFLTTRNIGERAFSGCTSLTAVEFPTAISIKQWAFNSCTSLITIEFPTVTSIQTGAFYNCSNLTTADFSAVTRIGSDEFNSCTSLTALIFRNETMSSLSHLSALSGTPIASGTGYIYVPAALVDTYKAATNWSTYAAQIRAIEDYPEICG